MGFGPKASDIESGVRAVQDIVQLLYPDHSTEESLRVLGRLAEVLLTANAPLSFESMDRFLCDPGWRQSILSKVPATLNKPDDIWLAYPDQAVPRDSLDGNFVWLLNDRLKTSRHFDQLSDPDHTDDI